MSLKVILLIYVVSIHNKFFKVLCKKQKDPDLECSAFTPPGQTVDSCCMQKSLTQSMHSRIRKKTEGTSQQNLDLCEQPYGSVAKNTEALINEYFLCKKKYKVNDY